MLAARQAPLRSRLPKAEKIERFKDLLEKHKQDQEARDAGRRTQPPITLHQCAVSPPPCLSLSLSLSLSLEPKS